ncbi:MAG TPA: hypothetical protein DDZ80_30695 [Cyanobacteria bacterium UBA8803]|nr:hypothetical protein [Cyanobacteria bacterium UBA8803]
MPYVQEAIRNKFGRSPVLVDELELAVCLGAAIYGANCQTIEKQPIKSCSDQLETIPQSPLLTRAEEDIELSSARDIDYSHLRDLLAARQWQKADEETTKVMLAAAEREEEGYLEAKHIANFPYQDLRTIDRLWAKYSAGRFGFSVQKRIWEKVGGSQEFPTSGDRFLDLMDVAWEFEKTVGWVIREYGDWLGTKIIKDREYSLAAPEGHLPSDYQRLLRVRQYQGDEYGYFFSRIE